MAGARLMLLLLLLVVSALRVEVLESYKPGPGRTKNFTQPRGAAARPWASQAPSG
jgi:hypothetical protein